MGLFVAAHSAVPGASAQNVGARWKDHGPGTPNTPTGLQEHSVTASLDISPRGDAEQRPDPNSGECWEFNAACQADTERLGRALGRAVEAGSVVGLIGELGAGKTRLTQALAEELGVDRRSVGSPTFVLLQEYAGRLPIFHFDAYRLGDVDEFLQLGAEELFAAGGVSLIEWADRVADVLPQDRLSVDIEITGEASRRFRIRAGGPTAERLLARLREELPEKLREKL